MPINANAGGVNGKASVIDGDTLEIRGERIRLHGIDAPESSQLCEDVNGRTWACGQRATEALRAIIGTQDVLCSGSSKDRYGRLIAVCEAEVVLNEFMVRSGWALAYRTYSLDYVHQEQLASNNKVGIWAGQFVSPWEWRRGVRLAKTVNSDCPVKGNIAKSGERIYHVPTGMYYSRTKIDLSKGERCFSDETEAIQAGWRKSRR
ncbi:thermonuclease family protein [Thalassospira profundimaris]|nr:thermonuclease family protein [Thalassospira profundimaris]